MKPDEPDARESEEYEEVTYNLHPRKLRPGETIRLVFRDPAVGPEGCFVETTDDQGRSVKAGEWVRRDDGLWELVIKLPE